MYIYTLHTHEPDTYTDTCSVEQRECIHAFTPFALRWAGSIGEPSCQAQELHRHPSTLRRQTQRQCCVLYSTANFFAVTMPYKYKISDANLEVVGEGAGRMAADFAMITFRHSSKDTPPAGSPTMIVSFTSKCRTSLRCFSAAILQLHMRIMNQTMKSGESIYM